MALYSTVREWFAVPGRPPTIPDVIHIRLTVSDLAKTRFAYSPLAEVGESL
jgi:hypothetical protein